MSDTPPSEDRSARLHPLEDRRVRPPFFRENTESCEHRAQRRGKGPSSPVNIVLGNDEKGPSSPVNIVHYNKNMDPWVL